MEVLSRVEDDRRDAYTVLRHKTWEGYVAEQATASVPVVHNIEEDEQYSVLIEGFGLDADE